MQELKYNELETRASAELEQEFSALERKLMARQMIHREIEEMKKTGEAHSLSDEEVRLLTAFRRFKAQCKAGNVFKWQTRPAEGVTLHTDTSLISDPQEVR